MPQNNDHRRAARRIMKELKEPLELSAPLARELAPKLCRRDPASGESCAWNHGFWQYLRMMGLGGTPADHAQFFRDAFQKVARENRSPRVLISGAGDYCMLAHLLAAFRLEGNEPVVTVLDRCETPLWLNRWYADRESVRIETRCIDVLEYRAEEPFDALCTHGFFGFFSPEKRPVLLDSWHRLLRPGGVVITVNRLRSEAEGPRYAFDADQAGAFRDALLRRSDRLPPALRVPEQELVDYASLYVRRRSGHSIRSAGEIVQLFETAGFRIEQLICTPLNEKPSAEQSVPGSGGGAQYARIVARRP